MMCFYDTVLQRADKDYNNNSTGIQDTDCSVLTPENHRWFRDNRIQSNNDTYDPAMSLLHG
jgi:hypothetical protein